MPAMKQAKLDAKVWREFLPFIWHFTTHIFDGYNKICAQDFASKVHPKSIAKLMNLYVPVCQRNCSHMILLPTLHWPSYK